MFKKILFTYLIIQSLIVSADSIITCKKNFSDFHLASSYLENDHLKIDFESFAEKYIIKFDKDQKKVKSIEVTSNSPKVKALFTLKNSKIKHVLKKFSKEQIDEEFCSNNPCRSHYEYIKADMISEDFGKIASVTIEIDKEITYPDKVVSKSKFMVNNYDISKMANSTSCDGTILLKRRVLGDLEGELLE